MVFVLLGCVFVLLGCEDASPKSLTVPATPRRPVPSTVDSSTGTSAKLDAPPRAVVPEDRLRQELRGRQLVIDTNGAWSQSCRIRRACSATPRALSVCSPGQEAQPWPTLPGRAEHFTDPHVSVRGRLVMDDSAFSTAVRCEKGVCCNRRWAKMALAGPPYDLELVGLGCGGDESRLCCALSARGEEVIATGLLRYEGGRLLLASPELCRVE